VQSPRRHILPSRRLIAALIAEPGALTALLDHHGHTLRCGGGWNPLPAGVTDILAALPDPVPALIRGALSAGRDLTLKTRIGEPYAALSLTTVRAGRIAGVLRLVDRSREHALAEALGQAQRLQEVGELAGGIAHDFNNLLTAILGAADDLLGRAVPDDHEDLHQIRASASRGAQLVRQLLAFSQRQTLQPRVLVLDDAVSNTVSLLQRLLGSRVKLVLNLGAPGRLVHMDATQLDQVLVNLAINARNAMQDGGTLTITTDWRLVLTGESGPDAVPPGRYAMIEISDTGTGIPPDVLPRIFDPFFTTRRGEGGTGLGLSMVRGIIRQSGGYLSVHSQPAHGTCFTITLPRHEIVAAELPVLAAGLVPNMPVNSAHSRILLVDDEDAIRRLASRVLTRAGWSVTEADSAEAALEGDLSDLDCVVSDVAMPGLDGPGLVRALRLQHPKLPAILMSGYADATQRRALAAEDIAFLPKPFAMADLTAAVRHAVEQVAIAS
jgi:two-component system cell cycle sensor histidine kinase/response regulator CckA